jgi:MFS family permease
VVQISVRDTALTSSETWLNRTTFGVGLTSLFSDWSHEIATAILPAFLASIGAGAGWLGIIEGVSDGLSSLTKLAAGHYTDRLQHRKPVVVVGYMLTTLGTGAMAFAFRASHVLLARVTAWLGRGVRTPGRKALLAAGVSSTAYGRAFGFERMMDTLGAIVGPLTALWLLQWTSHNYRHVFLWSLIPGVLAVACFGLLVRESYNRTPTDHSFWAGLRNLPSSFRQFLLAVGIFGLGDFSHTLLILYATQALAPQRGKAAAASIAVVLYLLHNTFYALSAYVGGWIGDQVPQRKFILAAGYGLAFAMALILVGGPLHLFLLGAVFALGGIFVGIEEALEDSITAELVPAAQHGMAFGTMAAVNAVGDFASSFTVGLLWSRSSHSVAFSLAGAFFLVGAVLVLRSCLKPNSD